jgi:hypothetical protein
MGIVAAGKCHIIPLTRRLYVVVFVRRRKRILIIKNLPELYLAAHDKLIDATTKASGLHSHQAAYKLSNLVHSFLGRQGQNGYHKSSACKQDC